MLEAFIIVVVKSLFQILFQKGEIWSKLYRSVIMHLDG